MLFRLAAGVLCLAGCDQSAPPPDSGGPEGGLDASTDAGAIILIGLPPYTLVPAFSTSISDYYIRCNAGTNDATLVVAYQNGETQSPVSLAEDQLLTVGGQYYIRCLPSDFPYLDVYPPAADAGAPTPGYYLVNGLGAAPDGGSAGYAFALDTNGTPVWYARGSSIADVESLATDTISFVPNATVPYGFENGIDFTVRSLDNSTTTTLTASGSPTDVHELRLLPNGHYLLFTYPIETNVDLTGLGTFGTGETMADCEVQEIDTQNNLVWSWLASSHVDPVKESLEPATNTVNSATVVDVFHCNSIDVDSSGNLLVSMRHANALYYVDKTTGIVQWKVGGSAYNKDGAKLVVVTSDPEGTFSEQHDARFAATAGHITLFDDHGAPPATGLARGIEYAIDLTALTATMVWQHTGIAASVAEGSFRRYADGHSVIGWGLVTTDPRIVTEVDSNGVEVLNIASTGGASYRAVKVPTTQLSISVLRSTTAK